MGSKISIDKYVSRLEDILALNLKNLERVHLESKIPDSITQNIKVTSIDLSPVNHPQYSRIQFNNPET